MVIREHLRATQLDCTSTETQVFLLMILLLMAPSRRGHLVREFLTTEALTDQALPKLGSHVRDRSGRLGLSPTYARSGDGPPDAVAPGPVDQQQMRQNGRLLSAGEPDRRQPLDWAVRQERPV